MDGLEDQILSNKTQPWKESQNSRNSQSIVRKSQPRSKSLSQKKTYTKNKIFKEPVCTLVPSLPKKSRPCSLSVFERQSIENQNEKLSNLDNIGNNSLTIPDSQSFSKNSKNLTIRIIQDEELIPIEEQFWQNLFNGKIDLYNEFKKDFQF